MAVLVGIFLAVINLTTCNGRVKKSLRKYLIEAYGSSGPYDSEIELNETAIRCSLGSTKLEVDWSDVSGLIEQPEDFEVLVGKQQSVVVRRRYFVSDVEYDTWLNFARERTGSTSPSA